LFFWLAIRAIAIAGLFLSLILISLSVYGLFGAEHQMAWVVIGVPSVFLFVYTFKLIRLGSFSSEEVNKWYSGKKE
jgi:hypothetical protein